MGSKVNNIYNKNMLSQTAANYSYILVDKANDIWKETGVGITTWSNIWSYKDIAGTTTTPTASDKKIWRKHKSYVWNGVKDNNGIFLGTLDSNGVLQNFNNGNDDSFDWAVPVGVGVPVTQPSQWKQTSEVTLYDHYSAPLEMKDINGNFASTKMGDNDTKVMATGNAGYSEMFFSGVENNAGTSWSEPEVKTNNFTTSIYFHTGKSSIATTSNSEFGASMKSGEHRAGKYKLSVWVHKTNVGKACVRINVGSAPIPFNGETVTAGDWVLKTHYFDVTSSAVYPFVNSIDPTTVIYDDLMIRPVASTITGYVYNEWDELTYIIGNNGLATRFEYDAAGRLIKTSSEVINDAANGIVGGFKVVKTNIYNNRYLN